jgi:hypothetical protein
MAAALALGVARPPLVPAIIGAPDRHIEDAAVVSGTARYGTAQAPWVIAASGSLPSTSMASMRGRRAHQIPETGTLVTRPSTTGSACEVVDRQ